MTNTFLKALSATALFSFLSFNALAKDGPKLKNSIKNQQTITQTKSGSEMVLGSLSCHRVGRYLFVSYTKSQNVCMVINRAVESDSTHINTVKILPDNGPAKVYRFVSSTPYYVWNLDGSIQKLTCFVLPTQD